MLLMMMMMMMITMITMMMIILMLVVMVTNDNTCSVESPGLSHASITTCFALTLAHDRKNRAPGQGQVWTQFVLDVLGWCILYCL